jgi:hypothetical protein
MIFFFFLVPRCSRNSETHTVSRQNLIKKKLLECCYLCI